MSDLKKKLQMGFDAPAPIRKEEFLEHLNISENANKSNLKGFLFSQIGYISKSAWVFSLLSLIVAMLGIRYSDQHMIWIISGMTPLLALSIATESSRSERYGMAELEATTKHSLASVVLARLFIISMADLVAMLVITLIGYKAIGRTAVPTMLYVITPFLISVFLELYSVRKLRGRQSFYACIAISFLVSLSIYFIEFEFKTLYKPEFISAWVAAAILALIGVMVQGRKIIKNTEEIVVWNWL